MIEIFTVKPDLLNEALANYFKNTNKIVLPNNVDIIKTSHGKQRTPCDKDWYYKRAASVIRKIVVFVHRKKAFCVNTLSHKYGCSKNRGFRPSKHVRGSRGIIRKIIQDLEKAGWILKQDDGKRTITDLAKTEINQLINKIKE